MKNLALSDALATMRELGLKTVTRRGSDRYKAGDVVYHGEALYKCPEHGGIRYRRDRTMVKTSEDWRWKVDVLIPRYCAQRFARLFSLIREVRPEMLHDISEEQCIAEGMKPHEGGGWLDPGDKKNVVYATAKLAFKGAWERIHKPGAWEPNVRIFAIELGAPLTSRQAHELEKIPREERVASELAKRSC